MSGFFSVKNFSEFQHYSDRNPIWIKLYTRLLEDYEFALLPDASKWHLVGIWLLASRMNNRLPFNSTWVAKHINAVTLVDLTLLAKAGFIELEQNTEPAKTALAQSENCASAEKRREQVEQNREEDLSASADLCLPKFDDFWSKYPKDPNMSKKRARQLWDRLDLDKRYAAIQAVPAFVRYCDENKSWYRPLHAERFLSQERFEGYAAEPQLTPEQIEANKDRADKLMGRGKYAPTMQ